MSTDKMLYFLIVVVMLDVFGSNSDEWFEHFPKVSNNHAVVISICARSICRVYFNYILFVYSKWACPIRNLRNIIIDVFICMGEEMMINSQITNLQSNLYIYLHNIHNYIKVLKDKDSDDGIPTEWTLNFNWHKLWHSDWRFFINPPYNIQDDGFATYVYQPYTTAYSQSSIVVEVNFMLRKNTKPLQKHYILCKLLCNIQTTQSKKKICVCTRSLHITEDIWMLHIDNPPHRI